MNSTTDNDCIGEMANKCIGFRIRRLNRIISAYYDEGLKPFHIKISQLNLLIIIERKQRAKPTDLREYAQMDASTVSRNTERLLERGWIRALAAEDGRSHYLVITAEGRKLLKKIYPAWKQAQQRASNLLGKELVNLMHKTEQKFLPAA